LKLCAAKHNFKSYVIDGALVRTGSANWSPTGLKRQDNDVHYEVDVKLAALFETRFEAMWNRPTNRMTTTPAQ
jgi:phosphatidylserine/phosphatidylglycerophosphate/cardiolipin synthase-like enzyme